jgi:hypothetical protein
MSKPTKHSRILDFPLGVSLPGGRVNSLQEVTGNHRCDYILDYQQLVQTSSTLFSEGKQVFERVEGYYKPQRLRFISVEMIEGAGAYQRLAALPLDHPSRTFQAALHWRSANKTIPYYLFFNEGDEGGRCLFTARQGRVEKRTGETTATSFIRDWSVAPPLPVGFVPQPKRLHERYGGDPVTIHLGQRTYHNRLFVGGLEIQPEQRPEVNTVLNLGEECSRWVTSSSDHPADRWVNKGEDSDGMKMDEMVAEAQWVIERLVRGQKVLVHCVAGFNRSVTLCCAILMLIENLSAEAALARVRQNHPWALPDSHHWLVLRWLAQQLRNTKTV